jgi:pyruvate kinase
MMCPTISATLMAPSFSQKDRKDPVFGVKRGVNFVTLSFVGLRSRKYIIGSIYVEDSD